MLVVGLTGGIGSGKTVVSDMFAELGVPVLDADVVAREIVSPGQPALAAIRTHFGDQVITPDGELDRATLRSIVFRDQSALKWLENLTHPLIRENLQQSLDDLDSDYAILVSPLLLETDQHKMVCRILVIDVPETLQVQRAVARDKDQAEQIKRIIAAQASRENRLERADDVITNDADIATLKTAVTTLHESYLEIARQNERANGG